MSVTYAVGIDPGLVHTGVVQLVLYSDLKRFCVTPTVVEGTKTEDVVALVHPGQKIYVEDYRTRSAFNTDARMRDFVYSLKRDLPKHADFLDNMGVKQVVRQPLMELLHLWKFDQTTHHQDLRSAARIMLFGMLKDEALNRLLSNVVRDHLNGEDWRHV